MTLPLWLSRKIGRCPGCMGLSLGLTLLAWTLAAATLLLELPPVLTLSLGCAALAFTALTFAHIAAFTLRAARAEVTPCPNCGAGADVEAGELSPILAN